MIRSLGGQTFQTARGPLLAVLEDEYAQADMGDHTVEGTQPVLRCLTSDVARLALGKGVVITGAGRTLKVVRHEPDGTGMSLLMVNG